MIKKHLGLILCGLFMASLVGQTFEEIRVSKIRIFCDEAEYLWTIDGIERMDEDPGKVVLKAETITTFFSIKPGFVGSEKQILKRCDDSEQRLSDSGYFYESTIMVVPPKKNPNERTLVVTVTSGFLLRFSGGNAWAMFGKVGIGGERQSVRAYVGYNKNGVQYMYSHVGASPFSVGSNLFYYGPGENSGNLNTETTGNRFSSAALFEWACSPDTAVGVMPAVDGFGFSAPGYFSIQPYITHEKHLSCGTGSGYGLEMRGFWFPIHKAIKAEATGAVRFGMTPKIMLALKGSVGASLYDLPSAMAFDLFYTEDRTIRSGYSRDEVMFSHFGLASVELRYDFLDFKIPPMFNVSMQVFGFSDIATGLDIAGLNTAKVFDAYGLGLRVLFNNPVFAYFTLSYGINHLGKGRLLFCGTAGY